MLKIGIAQINTTTDVPANLQKVREYALRLAEKNVDAIVFPEATMVAFGSPLPAVVEEFGETWRAEISQLARETGAVVIVGEFESAGERVRNCAAAYFPDGRRSAYTKIHLYDAFGYHESETVEAGTQPVILDIAGVSVGFGICYDIRFPKLFAESSRRGAQVMIVPTAWAPGPGKVDQWKLLASTRALDSNTFVVAVDQADAEVSGVHVPANSPTGVGYSTVTSPFGRIIAQLGAGEGEAIVELDLDEVAQAQKSIPVLANAKLGY